MWIMIDHLHGECPERACPRRVTDTTCVNKRLASSMCGVPSSGTCGFVFTSHLPNRVEIYRSVFCPLRTTVDAREERACTLVS